MAQALTAVLAAKIAMLTQAIADHQTAIVALQNQIDALTALQNAITPQIQTLLDTLGAEMRLP